MDHEAENLKKKLISTLRSHPEGLTIADLSRLISAHRQTVTKYIFWLEGANLIHRRRIGAVTLHYLKANWERLRK